MKQLHLFGSSNSTAVPLVVADGMGVNSTAVLIGLHEHGMRPDAILFADTGSEKESTYDYIHERRRWLASVGFPDLVVVRYQVKDFKNWPPYFTLGQNCLTNGTLPSLAFGFKSCSLKWKVTPQNKWTDCWQPARDCWDAGKKVRKIIGYDCSARDRKRYAHAAGVEDPKYDYWYALIEWGWDREDCTAKIVQAGLPVPPKSACYFCPATKPAELLALKKKYLRLIVVLEARAAPRLQKIKGLWRNGCKGTRGAVKKPGRMTDFIRDEGLLPEEEIEQLIQTVPEEIVRNQHAFACGLEIPEWHDFLEAFTAEDGIDDPETLVRASDEQPHLRSA